MGARYGLAPTAECRSSTNEDALGLDTSDDEEDLRDVVEADAEQVFTDWRFR
ncbi:hypothetical protein [Streptomyces bikiniensis]|uniref:hypothetical protein n=1 Tax=Streptomyces bikiniensis TaxID=1896 RepID=UPI000AFB399B|nr:hypothetical protein [Streptomyces bikiniensis]